MSNFKKYLYLFTSFLNGYLLLEYLTNDILPSKIIIVTWGLYLVFNFFIDSLTIHYKQKSLKIFKDKYLPIIIDNNLTKKERIDKINQMNLESSNKEKK